MGRAASSRALAAFILARWCCAGVAFGQSILTVAGGGTDDGRPATAASLSSPLGIVADGSGNVYIADSRNNRIRKVSAGSGIISTVAGNGAEGFGGDGLPAVQTAVYTPQAVALDAAGNLYIADSTNYRVRRVDSTTSIITTIAGTGVFGDEGDNGPATAAKIKVPSSIAFGRNGDLYIVDRFSNRVRRVSAATGTITAVAGNGTWGFSGDGGPATAASFRLSGSTATTFNAEGPPSIAIDAAGNLYITDTFNDRIRRIDTSDVITTVAGGAGEGFSGDGGPATAAMLDRPTGIAFDSHGDLVFADQLNRRIRRISMATGVITTIAGSGGAGTGGDDGPATAATFTRPAGLALAPGGNLLVSDWGASRVRRIEAATGTIRLIAGTGSRFSGDGGPAIAAGIYGPASMASDRNGNLIISEHLGYRVRKLSGDGTISTIAGTGQTGISNDGGPADRSLIGYPGGIAFSARGDVLFADGQANSIRRIDAATGILTTVAGSRVRGDAGDNGPATAAKLNLSSSELTGGTFPDWPAGIAMNAAGDLFIADVFNHKIKKVDGATQIITTIAGKGSGGFSGDNGPATAAEFNRPTGLALDGTNRLYVTDTLNNRIRMIDLLSGIVTTVAGTGTAGFGGDGGPATAAMLLQPRGVALDGSGNLFIADSYNHVVRRVSSGVIATVAGMPKQSGFSGDFGPAREATLSSPLGVAVDSKHNLYVGDTDANRVRAVFACVNVAAPHLTSPAAAAPALTAPVLTWEKSDGAFRYDVYLSKQNPPAIIASDMSATTFVPSNLEPGATYYWRIVAKGDPFCSPVSNAGSEVRSFTMAGRCAIPPAFNLLQPSDGAAGVGSPVQLSWQASEAASLYDVYLGTSNPPPFVAVVSATAYTSPPLAANTTYYWSVVAHVACDAALTRTTPVQSFRVAGACSPASTFATGAPADGAHDVPLTTTLSWSASSGAAAYDLYLGTSSPPPAFLIDLTKTSVPISGLLAGRTYYWRVIAKVPCDQTKNASTPIASFITSTAGCAAAPPVSISFVPPGNVGIGQTYSVSWREPPDLGPDGFYVVERALDASFASVIDRQETFAASASFVSNAEGTYYHRVRAVRGCDPSRPGVPSAAAGVTVVRGASSVVFTIQPEAVVAAISEKLEDRKASFALENLGALPIQVILGKAEIDSVPFFTIVDPSGGDPVFVTLDPKKPKRFEIQFSGPPNDKVGTYQGIVFVASTGQGLAVTPYAFINLKIGGSVTVKPAFTSQGSVAEYAAFPPFAGDDSARPPLSIEVRNDGDTPMEIGGEVGPEVWLVPESGWNALAIPPHASRTVRLRTQRSRAPNGSALPRYTYFTVRSRNGQSARLLVQDNDAPSGAGGRSSLLAPGSRSFVVPHVVTTSTAISRVRLTNIASTAVQADLYFTPTGADGFDGSSVKRVTIVVPPNDVVSLIDPLVQLFNAAKPADGSLEVRAAPDAIGSLIVSASVFTPSAGGGSCSYEVPVLMLGEGARAGTGQTVAGVTADTGTAATLILAETSGTDPVRARVTLFDKSGTRKGDAAFDVARYGRRSVADVVKALGGLDSLDRGRIDVSVESGGGAVAALVTVIDRSSGRGATIVGQPSGAAGTSSSVAFAFRRLPSTGSAPVTVAPMVVNGAAFPVPNTVYRTSVGLTTSGSKVTAVVTYRDGSGASAPVSKTVDLFPGLLLHFDNVLEDLFGVATGSKATGSIFIESAAGAEIYAQLYSRVAGAPRWSIASNLPLLPTVSDVLTSLQSRRPLYLDGLEQSIDDTRGTKWLVVLDETRGSGGTVSVRLYEAGNRSVPIAERTISIAAYEQLSLDVFRELGLDGEDRRKDRTNVLCVVAASAGGATISASGIAIDNRTGDTHTYLFSPNGGVPATGVSRVSLVSQVPTVSKRRIVKP